jgi:hypothetical protein
MEKISIYGRFKCMQFSWEFMGKELLGIVDESEVEPTTIGDALPNLKPSPRVGLGF